MFHLLGIFFITALISFVGSVQLGPVNLAIMKSVLEGRAKSGLIIGAGVCIPEFIYSTFALFASAWLLQRHGLLMILEWSIVPLLIGMGIFNILKKTNTEEETAAEKAEDFVKGFFLSLFNPQLLPFWLTMLVMLNGYDFFAIKNTGDRIAFIAGTGCGEFALIMFVVWVTSKFREYLMNKMKTWNLNKIFGWLFILLALAQSLKLLLHFTK
jgi:threonine/homoserine/homoserine lactone efflux protein